ncbi:hypothetical protein U1700_00970 [Sphingomonas sp. RB1R13]
MFAANKDEDKWHAELGVLPWPKFRDMIEWLNEASFRYGFFVEIGSVENITKDGGVRVHGVKVNLYSPADKDHFQVRWERYLT